MRLLNLGAVFKLVRSTAHNLGVELRRFDALRDDPHLRVARLCQAQKIDLLVDVGASDGAWAQAVRDAGFKGRIVSFEPHPTVVERLRARAAADGVWDAHQLAVGPDEGTMPLRMPGGSVWSSLLPPASRSFEPTQATAMTNVDVRRLDHQLDSTRASRIFLKLDVQGFELEALRSAEGVLPQVQVGKVEVLLRQVYDGQPSLLDVLHFLDGHGFHVIGFEHGHLEDSGKERFVDVIFSREPVG